MNSAILELLRRRRSIRSFAATPIDDSALETLREAALRAPTSRGINPWHFIFADEPDLICRIADAKTHGSAFIKGAALAIVVCADETATDVWVEDCSIAAITLHYAATDLGLGSCWVQIRNRAHNDNSSAEEYLQRLFDLPKQLRVEAVIGIGHPAEDKPGHPATELMQDRLHKNRYR